VLLCLPRILLFLKRKGRRMGKKKKVALT
jgi:hypothetical protein